MDKEQLPYNTREQKLQHNDEQGTRLGYLDKKTYKWLVNI